MVRNRLAWTLVNLSTFCVIGHSISIKSTWVHDLRPKWRSKSLCDGILVPCAKKFTPTTDRCICCCCVRRTGANQITIQCGASDGTIRLRVRTAEAQEERKYRLPEALAEKQQLREAIRSSLAEMKTIGREHWRPQEPEAPAMKGEWRPEPAYDARLTVNQEHQLIVAEAVVNRQNDPHQLTTMIAEPQG